ncbi:uncharacterized protein RHOBADRAFT_56311 [Rhodotorula graminis WP1]|uniref:Uncharacterized protein n=1 Tax=Rhodotorula graminis (strain WP1) TaxID=578459 RepID=A0A0P9GWZ1_RHOGW|nr:uncharacterized protein RHOBADRAFT_56311 [Rhodotorula graminis WP1]KPV71935.1 hypothetical protein RHOBADRAFT_56311 [Rhodotorula graminis WP1]
MRSSSSLASPTSSPSSPRAAQLPWASRTTTRAPRAAAATRARAPPTARPRDKDKDSHRHRRDRSPSDDKDGGPPPGVDELSDDDYFLKATELKLWLYEDRGKKLDSLKTEDARRYFRKLDAKYYAGIAPGSLPSSISTSHSWSFKKASQADLDAAATVRRSVDGTKTRSYDPTAAPGPAPPPPSSSSSSRAVAGPSRGPQLGPAMPPSSAVERLQMERDARDSTRSAEREAYAASRRRDAREGRHAERDERATGRDRLVEKRREGNASRRDFEASREGGGMMDFDEDALMSGSTGAGGGPAGPGSFEDAVKARERAQSRREERKFGGEEKRAEMTDRLSAHRQKEDATMAMFKQLAAQRFGGAGAS